MYKGKTFRFKNAESIQKFIECWNSGNNQQQEVAEFIGTGTFEVVSCTPVGSVRAIQRHKDAGKIFYTQYPEPLIDASEMLLFFVEAEQGEEVAQFDPTNIKELHRCSSKTLMLLAAAVAKTEYAGLQGNTAFQVEAQKEFDSVLSDVKAEIIANAPTL